MSDRSIASACLFLCLPFVAMVSAGCDGASEGIVAGRVTYQQKPVSAGIVNFYAPALGAAAQADLDESGAFTIPGGLPAGTYKVAVMPPLVEQLPPGSPLPAPKPFDVPAKYRDAAQTPLEREVKAGENEFEIDLAD